MPVKAGNYNPHHHLNQLNGFSSRFCAVRLNKVASWLAILDSVVNELDETPIKIFNIIRRL